MNNVIGMLIRRKWSPISRSKVFKKFDTRTFRPPQCSDSQVRSKHVVQVFLFGTVVFAFPGYMHAENVAVELQASIRIRNHDRSVVDAQKQLFARAVPLLRTLARRKMQDLDLMSVSIFEIERGDSTGILVPVRQKLRAR